MLIRMANHAPLLSIAGNQGAELDGDLCVYAKAKVEFPVLLCTEPEFIELDRVAIAVFPYPRKAEFVGMPEEAGLQQAFVEQLEEFNGRFAQRLDWSVCSSATSARRAPESAVDSLWSDDVPSTRWIHCETCMHSTWAQSRSSSSAASASGWYAGSLLRCDYSERKIRDITSSDLKNPI
jgi:hypothetical protein